MRLGRGAVAALAIVCSSLCSAPAHAAPSTVYGLGLGGSNNTLFRFSVTAPTTATPVVVGGVFGVALRGIDFRPATGDLYGFATSGNTALTYIINPLTGAATFVGAATVNTIAGATSFGVDFNPATDRIRVTTNLASDGVGGNVNNFRLNPNDGDLAGVDADLDFTGPGGGAAPEVGVAYDNNVPGAASTTLRGITSGEANDRLVINGGAGPQFSTLQNVGNLGVDTTSSAGFDIDGETGAAYAILEVGGVSGLYTINLTTAEATLVGNVGNGTVDFGGFSIPIVLPVVSFAATLTSIGEGDTADVTVTRTGQLGAPSSVNYATEIAGANNTSGGDFTAVSGTLTFAAGVASQTISVPTTEDGADEPDETFQIRLSSPATATLSADPVTTVNIVDDDIDPKDAVPPVGLISVPAQKIDRKISARFACDDACASKLTLKLGAKTLDTDSQTLADSGVAKVTFALSAKEVKLVKKQARGKRSANLRVLGSFSDAQGASSSTAKFQLG